MDRFLAALRPGALLLLGYSESLFKVYDRFEMVEMEGAFVYRRPVKPLAPRALGRRRRAPSRTRRPPPRCCRPPGPSGRRWHRVQQGAPRYPGRRWRCPARQGSRDGSSAGPHGQTPSESPRKSARGSAPRGSEQPARARRAGELPAWSLMLSPGERLNAAVRMIERGDFVSAVATVEQLLADEPDHLDALLTAGQPLLADGTHRGRARGLRAGHQPRAAVRGGAGVRRTGGAAGRRARRGPLASWARRSSWSPRWPSGTT